MNASLPIFPTSVVGNHAMMGWWCLVRREAEAGRMGARDLAEALDAAVESRFSTQERAGVDVISDGEMRRLSSFFRSI
jgi:5-methyltetrahydropteroyltriglutamate--homocysteine methyltransferase